MTDMTERLRENAPMGGHAAIRNLMYHAADEIERLSDRIVDLEMSVIAAEEHSDEGWYLAGSFEDRITELDGLIKTANEKAVALRNENEELRGIIQQAADDVVAASYPRTMHLEWLEAARKALAEDD